MTDWIDRLRMATDYVREERETATLREALRGILAENPDGLTVPDLARITGRREGNVYTVLQHKPEFWIDRWERTGKRGAPRAVWMAPPPDCPRPDTINNTRSRKQ